MAVTRGTCFERLEWARNTHSSEIEADLQVAYQLNGSNLRDTGHSSERSRMAVLAELQGSPFGSFRSGAAVRMAVAKRR